MVTDFCRIAIAKGKSYSYILQFAISLGQLYGTAVYFITSYLEGDKFAASPYYYYAYYVAANASWVVIPSLICIRCWKKICAAVQLQGQKKTKVRWGSIQSVSFGITEVSDDASHCVISYNVTFLIY